MIKIRSPNRFENKNDGIGLKLVPQTKSFANSFSARNIKRENEHTSNVIYQHIVWCNYICRQTRSYK